MARLQRHHITYEPEWVVEITWTMHKILTTVQMTRASEEQYARLTNFYHAIGYEWNRMRQELDSGLDLRTVKPKRKLKRRKKKMK